MSEIRPAVGLLIQARIGSAAHTRFRVRPFRFVLTSAIKRANTRLSGGIR